jgi:large subunit ribosomal protein L9
MEVILLKDVDKLGYKHEVVNVKPGFGRNYLIPQGMALLANRSNKARLAELVKQSEIKDSKMLGHYEELAEKMKSIVLKIGAKAGSSGKIFGSVTDLQLAQALNEVHGIEVERRKIEMPEDVKHVGAYEATIRLHKDVEAKLSFEVIEE